MTPSMASKGCGCSGDGSLEPLEGWIGIQHAIEAPLLPVLPLSGFAAGIGAQGALIYLACFASLPACEAAILVGGGSAVVLGFGAYKFSQSLPAYYRDWWHDITRPVPPASGSPGCGG
jgi:hypothetical protein